MSWREAGRAAGKALLDSVREWTAVLGGLGAGLLINRVRLAGGVPRHVRSHPSEQGSGRAGWARFSGSCAWYWPWPRRPRRFCGVRDRDLGGWAAAVIALVLGIATFVAFGLAAGT